MQIQVMKEIIGILAEQHNAEDDQLKKWIALEGETLKNGKEEQESLEEELFQAADKVRRAVYGDEVYIRGLIEDNLSNISKSLLAFIAFYNGINDEELSIKQLIH